MTQKNPIIEVDRLREEIARVRDEIAWIDKSPLPKDDWKARVASWVRAQAASDTRHANALRHLRSPGRPDSERGDCGRLVTSVLIPAKQVPDIQPVELSIAPFMAWLYGDDLVRRLHALIDVEDYVPGPPLAERATRRQELLKELHALECEEEAVIVAAEGEQVLIARRADADPAVVPAYDPHGAMIADGLRGCVSGPRVVAGSA